MSGFDKPIKIKGEDALIKATAEGFKAFDANNEAHFPVGSEFKPNGQLDYYSTKSKSGINYHVVLCGTIDDVSTDLWVSMLRKTKIDCATREKVEPRGFNAVVRGLDFRGKTNKEVGEMVLNLLKVEEKENEYYPLLISGIVGTFRDKNGTPRDGEMKQFDIMK